MTKRLVPRTGHDRCKYPSTIVFAKVTLEAAAWQFSLNHLSASRFTDVDLRTCFDCKRLIVRYFRKYPVPGKFHPLEYGALRIRWNALRPQCFWPAATRFALSPRQCLAAAIAPRRRKKVCSASIQSARRGSLRAEAGSVQSDFQSIWITDLVPADYKPRLNAH